MGRVQKTIVVDATPDEVFDIAQDPQAWANWFVGLSGPESLKGTGEVGTIGQFRYTLLGIRFPVAIEVTEVKKTNQGYRWRASIRGSLTGTLTETYTECEGGTEVTILFAYNAPWGILGRVPDRLFMRRMQEKATEESLKNLKLLVECQAR